MTDPLVQTWQTHLRLNRLLVEAIPSETLPAKLAGRGRSAAAILAHLHNTRLNWLEPMAPDLGAGLAKVGRDQVNSKSVLLDGLQASGATVTALIERSLAAGGQLKGFRGHVTTFTAYLIAHDAYHHGEIGLILSQAGFRLPDEVAYGIWEWRAAPGQDS